MSKGRSSKVRKTESPEISPKSKVGSPTSGEQNNSAFDSEVKEHSAIGTSHSELNKSETATALLSTAENKQPRKIVNRKSEIEIMEVHHHPEVEKKGLKEYLLEGLMIFLAVMMGFFAESLREHIADGDHEKQSIESLVKAIVIDTVQLHDVIGQATGSIKAINNLMGLKNLDLTRAANKQKFYLFSLAGFSNDTYFRSNDGALQQLNSSGTLRLISNRATVDSIFKYELLNKNIAAQEADDYFVFKEMLTTMTRVEDLTIFLDTSTVHKRLAGNGGVQYSFIGDKLPAISNDKVLMQAYFNYASLYLATKSSYNYMLQKHLDYSRRLISYLKTVYKIE